MPPEGVRVRPHGDILRYEEITQIVRVAAEHGIQRIRLTGGEPLIRRDLVALVRQLAGLPGIEEVSLTTNAFKLAEMAAPLAEAGLKRINVSLDTLDEQKFRQITRGGSIEQVWKGIQAAEEAGLSPIKINAVVIRGVNDDELIDLARLSESHPWQVRFIELMPIENEHDWGPGLPPPGERLVPVQEIRRRLGPLNLIENRDPVGNGPARTYQIAGAPGSIGFISPVGEHFCAQCNRLRLTADGNLRPCLLHNIEVPVRDALRAGEDLLPYLWEAVRLKPEGHSLCDVPGEGRDLTRQGLGRSMSQIGG
jgi:cyclic pyranopterin phosphate synthase